MAEVVGSTTSRCFPGATCMPHGDQAGRYATRVNDQYRIAFRWEGHDGFDVRCEDYH